MATKTKTQPKKTTATGMAGFLILARSAMDDIPLKLAAQRAAASRFARGVTLASVRKRAQELDLTTETLREVLSVVLIEFRDGLPVTVEVVKQGTPDLSAIGK